jgi:WD40 repeat protein
MELELTGGVAELQATHDRAAPPPARRRSLVCPYKGLAAFDAADSEYYCGRERLVAELVARLVGTSLLGLVGPSGSGKSSLLRAGLLAALADGILPGSERWGLTLIRPGEHPRATLDYVNLGGRVVLAVDQFEETFTTCPDEPERVAFIAELVRLAGTQDGRCTVVLVLRADHYGRCADYPELARLLVGSHVLVPPMRPDELRRAIELPAERAGLEVEEGLAERLAGDVAGEPGALPLLSTALLDLWQRRDGRRLSVAAYEQIGGVRAAVARLAEDAYERLEPGERDVARRILLRLVVEREAGVFERRRMPLPEVGEELSVIDRLSDERLLTITEGTVEVAHEALFREWPRLRAWLEEDAESRRVHRDLADATRVWESDGRVSDDLYRGARLASALEWRSRHEHDVEAGEHAFLTASAAAASRGRRRLQAGVVGLALLLVAAGAAGLVALHQRGNALAVARTAQAQRLGAQGLGEQALDRALLLAAEGVALEDSAVTRSQLLRALLRSPAATWIMRGGSPMTAVDTSPDGRVVAVGDEAGSTTLVDPRTRRRSRPITVGRGPVSDVRFSPDGTRLAVATAGLVVLLDSRSRRPVADWNVDSQVTVRALAFSADSRTLAASVSHEYEYDADAEARVPQPTARVSLPIIDPRATEEEIIRWDARTGRQLDPFPRVLGRLGPVFIDFSSTNHRLIAVDARTGETTIRDARTLATVRRFGVAGSPAAVSPDRRILGLGAADGSVRFLDLDTGVVRRGKGGHGTRIQHMRFSADSRRLATAGRNGEVIIWDTEQAASVGTLSGHAAAVTAVSLSPDRRSAYSVGLDGALIASDLTASRGVGREFHTGGGLEFTGILAAAADGGVFAVIDSELNIQAYDSRTLKLIRRVRATRSLIPLDLAIAPDGRTIAVSVEHRGLVLVDTGTGRMTALPGTRPLSRFAFSPDGRWFAVADELRRKLELWDRRGPMRRPLRSAPLELDAALATTPVFDPGGRWLAVARPIGRFQLELWSIPRLEPVRRTAVPEGAAGTFDPAGETFAHGDVLGRTWLYDTSTLAATGAPLAGRDGAIASMSYSGSGRMLATASIRGPARLRDLTSDPPTATALTDGDAIPKAVAFIRDGSHLLSISGDGHGRVWDLRPSEWLRRACAIAGRNLTRAEWQESLPDRPYAPVCRR